MLWYKSWLDTRWAFLIGLALIVVAGCSHVFTFETVRELVGSVSAEDLGEGPLAAELREAVELQATFRGYLWSNWFAANFLYLLTVLAAVLGSGSPLSGSGRGVLFSLALPVSRGRWLATRTGLALLELLALALVPSVAIVGLAPLAGEEVALAEALVYGLSAFVVASVFLGLAALLSTVFDDLWRPLLLTVCGAFAIGAMRFALPEGRGLFAAMAGRSYFFDGSLLWPELVLAVVAATALIYAAAANIARRDF
jgi:ABC-type transport system involved in multi-copper enzyme maturation permease subunit